MAAILSRLQCVNTKEIVMFFSPGSNCLDIVSFQLNYIHNVTAWGRWLYWVLWLGKDKSAKNKGIYELTTFDSSRTCLFTDCDTKRVLRNVLRGPLTRYAKLRVAHAPGMPGTFFPPPRVSDSDMHHGTCVTHVPWCMTGSLTSGFIWNRWWGKRSRHSRRMHNPQFCVSGKRPMCCGQSEAIVVFDCGLAPIYSV